MRDVIRHGAEPNRHHPLTSGALRQSYLATAIGSAADHQARTTAVRAASPCEVTLQANPPTPLFPKGLNL